LTALLLVSNYLQNTTRSNS